MQQPPPIGPDQMARYVAAKSAEDEEIGRKKDFWLKMIWISLLGTVLPLGGGFVVTVIQMSSAFKTMGGPGANVDELSQHIFQVMTATMVGMAVSALVFVFLIVAVVRFFTLPGRRARMMDQGL